MATSVAMLTKWFNQGKQDPQNTHMIIVCDTYDWEDYPVYVTKHQNVRETHEQYHSMPMQKVMEVYNYALPTESQLIGGVRVMNF